VLKPQVPLSEEYLPLQWNCHPDRSEAHWRGLRFPFPEPVFRTITTLPFVISTEAQRSGEICGSAVPSWKCFRQRSHGPLGPPKLMKSGSCSATSLSGSAALPFVISTGAQRSGEISVWMPFLGNVFRQTCGFPGPSRALLTSASLNLNWGILRICGYCWWKTRCGWRRT
jgi:hypothetical protein